eukprot:gene3637-6838_t
MYTAAADVDIEDTPVTEDFKDAEWEKELEQIQLEEEQVRNGTHPDFLKAMQDFTYLSELKLQCATILSAQTKATAKKEHKAEANALSAKGKATRQETRKRMIEEVEMEKQKCIDWYNTVKIDTDMMNGRSGRQTRRRVQRGDEDSERLAKEEQESADAEEKAKKAVPIFRLDLLAAEVEEERECYYEHVPVPEDKVAYGDKLRYDGKWFYRFQKVTVEVESYKITGVITSISPVTLWIRRKINGLHPVTLGDLKTGKALLRLATGREN